MKETYRVCRGDGQHWDDILRVDLKETGWLEPAGVKAWAQLCHDGEKLYVRLGAEETHIRATLTGTLDQVCNDSCLEFFFAPVAEDPRYFNFEWNPLKALNLGFGGARPTRVRQIVKKMEELFCPQSWQSEDAWGIQFSIPAEFVGRYFPGFAWEGECHANFYKCGDETDHPHYLAWSPLECDKPDYHRRGDFGTLIFE
ncbi:carbohydrate-binding family 9-like protein [Pseudoflavonifractor sp. An85]|uniref:carbohydrate-binding family 9-like protein n=1 Tax=Pseudoflavonifractor sp. An85 TaxID=1965661 RepID=UPI000B36E438|nr:carbohydrate-binding family 9-like protein [Pseudoflavonifractor sp. An85]OUN25050.1 hypothetical protein B5G37_05175 [Pseudoflavonifractor sp. An85]